MSMLHAMMDTVAVSIGMGHRPAIARAHKWSTPAGCGAGVFCWLQPFGYQLDGSEPSACRQPAPRLAPETMRPCESTPAPI